MSDALPSKYGPTWVLANADLGIEMPRGQPEAWVGHKCKVFWPDDAEWYDAVVRAYDRSNGKHNVWYSYDQQVSLHSSPFSHVHCSCHVALKLPLALFNPKTSNVIQKRHPYTGNLNSQTSGDSKNVF